MSSTEGQSIAFYATPGIQTTFVNLQWRLGTEFRQLICRQYLYSKCSVKQHRLLYGSYLCSMSAIHRNQIADQGIMHCMTVNILKLNLIYVTRYHVEYRHISLHRYWKKIKQGVAKQELAVLLGIIHNF